MLEKCSICGKDRREKFEKDAILWRTDIMVIDASHSIPIISGRNIITVCPECRKKPLQEILIKTDFGRIDNHNLR